MISQRAEQQMDRSTTHSASPQRHADSTVFISRLRGYGLIFSNPPTVLPCHPFALASFHLIRSARCSSAGLSALHFSLCPSFKNLSVSSFPLSFPLVPGSHPLLPPSLTCCSLTLPLSAPSSSPIAPPSLSICFFLSTIPAKLTWCMVLRGFPAEVTIVVSDRCVCVYVCVPSVLLQAFTQQWRLVMAQAAIQGKCVSAVTDLEYSAFIQ